MKTIKICTVCKNELPIEDFNWSEKKKNKRRSMCKRCQVKHLKDVYKRKQKVVDEIKEQSGCKKCGDKRSYVLDFHHLDPTIKEMPISAMLNSCNIENILREIEKCVVLCANCHREFHYLENQSNLTIEEYLSNSQNKFSENFEKGLDKVI